MISLFGWEKGGVGKTNTAVQMAAMLALANKDVVLIDGDKQQSASNWAAIRTGSDTNPLPVPCATRLGRSVATDAALFGEKYKNVVIDAGGRDSAELRFAMAVADIVVMPISPGQYEAWAVDTMVALKKEIEDKIGRAVRVAAFINMGNPSTSEVQETRDYLLEGYADVLELFDTTLFDRIVHRRSAREGLSVIEMTGAFADPKAVSEVKSLYAEVYGEQWKKA